MVDLREWCEAWYSLLPRDVLDRAYKAGGESAWNRADALRVVALVQHHGYRVIGVETWLPTRPGPTPLIDDWNGDRPMSATAFIEAFRWEPMDDADRGIEVHFNISTNP